MRKWISLLLVLVMMLSMLPVCASASESTGSIRHEVYGDVSEFEVGEEQGNSQLSEDRTEAQAGTDLYLFVDPDTASAIVFYVTDEYGNPIEGALIWISYNGKTELYGVTDKNGKLATYLFRNVEYGYTVEKEGYESASGTFTATEETKFIHVVLRKYYTLDIYVVEDGEPVPGVTVIIDNNPYITDENGRVRVIRTNGVYDVVVVTPDGRRIPLKAVVNGDTVIVVDISRDDSIVKGGLYSDRFLVYNRDYDPEDYVLTKYSFDEKDVPKADSDEYLDSVRNTVLIKAQPDRKPNDGGKDFDVLDKNGDPVYSQRSLMPTGFVLKAWEDEGFEHIVFTNEEMALGFDVDSLHSEKLMKLYGIVWYLSNSDVKLKDIASKETFEKWNGYEEAGFNTLSRWAVELGRVDLDALKDFCFKFDENKDTPKDTVILDDAYFTNSLFEFRLTPILPESLMSMISDGLIGRQSMPMTDIMLASWGFYAEELRRAAARGELTEAEYDELYAFMVDSKLSAEEIQQLKEKKALGKLSEAELKVLLDAAADEKMYRVSCWLSYEDIVVDISDIISGVELIRKADRQFEEILETERAELAAQNKELSEKELAALAEQKLEERYEFMLVDYDPARYTMDDYKACEFTSFEAAELVCALDEDGEFYSVISEKSFEQLIVDVRKDTVRIKGAQHKFKADITVGESKLEQSRALRCSCQGLLLTALTYK